MARLNLMQREMEIETATKVHQSGGNSNLGDAQYELALAQYFVRKVGEELENRPMIMEKTININDNRGTVLTGEHSSANYIINDNSNTVKNIINNSVNGDGASINVVAGQTISGSGISLSQLSEQLVKHGVNESLIKELQDIAASEKDKTAFMTKAFSWIGRVTANLAEKALVENIPTITHLVTEFANTL